ncbi:hypothetical protein BX616_001421 [Lobosporangium transversale]|nr:hypothetical protein BX616_001421 [Lobosporangium transversale]
MAVSRAMRQIILMGIICFGTIGMFNAMSSIGNAGKHSPTAQNLAITSSSIAYIVGFLLAGGTHNMIGPRLCVVFGGLSFVLYAGSMLLAKDDDRSIYPPLAGILLGLGAGLIWVTHGAMMMSYPTEDNKGKYIAVFWAIFNLGAVIGSILPLVMNSAPGMDPDDVSPTTYIVYMVVMGLATLLAFFLARPSTIVRDNGEAVSVAKFSGLRAECVAILAVFCDWRMLLLIPAFFFSNFSYTYQFNDFNGFNFNIRTRSLNSMLFWIAQIIGAVVLGYLLDRIPVKRSRRAVLGLILVGVLFMATWVAALMVQLRHNWERKQLQSNDLIDYEHGSTYTGLLAIYAMFGFCDAAFAVYCYWLMGALSNKHDELSRYAGFFKSIQSLGGAVAAPLDLAQTPLKEYLITNWILCALSIAAMFLVCRTVTDTTIDDYDEQGDQSQEYGENEDEPCCNASINEAGEAAAQMQSSRDRSSLEADVTTICATNEAGKMGPSMSSRQNPSISRYMNSRVSGVQEDNIEEENPTQTAPHESMLNSVGNVSFNHDIASYGSMNAPLQIYQNHLQDSYHQPLDRNPYFVGSMPPMAEIQHHSSIRLRPTYSTNYVQSEAESSGAFQQISHQTSTLQPPSTYSYSSQSSPIPNNFQAVSAPTLMISDDSTPPMPLYSPYLHMQPPAESPTPAVSNEAGEGDANIVPTIANPSAVGHLQPYGLFEQVVGPVSSGSSTRYDDEQDMDSIDSHSISSMLSDHDSIPEMTEMSETTREPHL